MARPEPVLSLMLPTIANMSEDVQGALVRSWTALQLGAKGMRRDLIGEAELHNQSKTFVTLLCRAAQSGTRDIQAPPWAEVRSLLSDLSAERARTGFTPTETATFVLSLKQPILELFRERMTSEELVDAYWAVTVLVDELALLTTEIFLATRERIISQQREDMTELSTPVVELWDGIVALPVIGMLDSERTQQVMEALLEKIVEKEADIAILDITGVTTVDTKTAQHLMKTVAAARLMGAECIISGIRPQIAQTIVNLGISLGDVVTRSTMAAALAYAFQRRGWTVKGTPS